MLDFKSQLCLIAFPETLNIVKYDLTLSTKSSSKVGLIDRICFRLSRKDKRFHVHHKSYEIDHCYYLHLS